MHGRDSVLGFGLALLVLGVFGALFDTDLPVWAVALGAILVTMVALSLGPRHARTGEARVKR